MRLQAVFVPSGAQTNHKFAMPPGNTCCKAVHALKQSSAQGNQHISSAEMTSSVNLYGFQAVPPALSFKMNQALPVLVFSER